MFVLNEQDICIYVYNSYNLKLGDIIHFKRNPTCINSIVRVFHMIELNIQWEDGGQKRWIFRFKSIILKWQIIVG